MMTNAGLRDTLTRSMAGDTKLGEDRTSKKASVQPPPHVPAVFELTIVQGSDVGRVVTLDASLPCRLLVGQSRACTFCIRDPAVSRRHASLEVTGQRLRLLDLDSTNGTTVNDVLVRDALLVGGERVRLGDTLISVTRKAPRFIDLPRLTSFGRLLGASPAMRKLHPVFETLATLSVHVLVEGEGGVGKELLAEELHAKGPRARQPFIALDRGMLNDAELESLLHADGVVGQAAGGTLFIDEVGALGPAAQAALLNVAATAVRIIAATQRDLERDVDEGRFREDLLFHLAGARVELPPLRDRAGDALFLAAAFWTELGGTGPLPPDFAARWDGHAWPGNVRELKGAVLARLVNGEERTAVAPSPGPVDSAFFDAILADNLPYSRARQRVLAEFETRYIRRVLALHGGNVARAAAASGLAHRYFQVIKARKR